MSISLEGIFVPPPVQEELADYATREIAPIDRGLYDPPLEAITRLAVVVGKSAVSCFVQGNLKQFDASAGDLNCELQAMQLRDLYRDESIQEEMRSLSASLRLVEQATAKRTSDMPLDQFTRQQLGAIRVSEKVAYLLRCRFLSMVNREGVDLGRLHDGIPSAERKVVPLPKAIRSLSEPSRDAIRSSMALELSRASCAALGEPLPFIQFKEEAPLVSSSFARMKGVLEHFREQSALFILLKNGNAGQFFYLKEFALTDKRPKENEVVVIFQMKIFDPGQLKVDLEKRGLEEILLMHEAVRPDPEMELPEELAREKAGYQVLREGYVMPMEYDHCYSVLASRR